MPLDIITYNKLQKAIKDGNNLAGWTEESEQLNGKITEVDTRLTSELAENTEQINDITNLPNKNISDITTRIQQMFDDNPNGGSFRIPDGEYVLTNSLKPPSNSVIYGTPNKTKLICANNSAGFRITNKSNIVIKDLEIEGNTTTGSTSQHGVRVENSSHITIENVRITDVFQDGVIIDVSNNIFVKNVVISNGLIALLAHESANVLFESVKTISPRFNYGVQFKSCVDSKMINCDVVDPVDVGIYVNQNIDDPLNLGTVPQNIILSHCKVTGLQGTGTNGSKAGIEVANGIDDGNIIIEGCEATNNNGHGLKYASNDGRISNCTFSNNALNGVLLNGNRTILESCTINKNVNNGIEINASDVVIEKNTLKDNNTANNSNNGNVKFTSATSPVVNGNKIILTANTNNMVVSGLSGGNIMGNSIVNTVGSYDIKSTLTTDSLNWSNNGNVRFSNLRGVVGNADITVKSGKLEVRDLYGSIPTNGSWSVGDKVYNKNISAGGYEAWLCTGTGTTFKGVGSIAS